MAVRFLQVSCPYATAVVDADYTGAPAGRYFGGFAVAEPVLAYAQQYGYILTLSWVNVLNRLLRESVEVGQDGPDDDRLIGNPQHPVSMDFFARRTSRCYIFQD